MVWHNSLEMLTLVIAKTKMITILFYRFFLHNFFN